MSFLIYILFLWLIILVYNSCSFQFLTLFLILTDETLNEDILIANTPTLTVMISVISIRSTI